MKRILTVSLILTFCLLLMTVPAFATYNAATNTVSLEVSFSPPQVTHSSIGPHYSHVEMEGTRSLGNVGEPVLPVKGLKALIPPDTKVKNVTVTLGEKISLPEYYQIEPGQKEYPLSLMDQITVTPDKPKADIYQTDASYPPLRSKFHDVQKKKGYSIAVIELHPLEYNPVKGELSYYESMTVNIKLEPESAPVSSPSIPGAPRLRAAADIVDVDKAEIERLIDNKEDLAVYNDVLLSAASAAAGMERISDSIVPGQRFAYCIITSANFSAAFEPLKLRRSQNGLPATIVTTEWIYANYPGIRPDGGTDRQTKIRNFIIDAYNVWGVRYVLLAGDGDGKDVGGESGDNIIPARGLAEGYPGEYDQNIPADLYYACLNGTFDNDADGIYGENKDGINGGEVDLVAEVYVGRAPVDSVEEANHFVAKTLAYEDTTDDYLNHNYMVGEFLGFGGVAEYATAAMEEIRLGSSRARYTTQGFISNPDRALTADTLYDSPLMPWNKTALLSIINNGVHVLNHLGHANNVNDMKLENIDADRLVNTKYFIGYSQGCYPGAFDNRTPEEYFPKDTIVEHLVTNATGAAAFVANSRYGWGLLNSTNGSSQYYARQYWDALFGEGIKELGKMNQDSKEDNIPYLNIGMNRWCYWQLNLFGDPALAMHLPKTLVMDVVASSLPNPPINKDLDLFVDLKAFNKSAYNVSAVLSSDNPRILITQDNANYGVVPKGEAVHNSTPFKLTFPNTLGGDCSIEFTLLVTANGYQKELHFTIEFFDPRKSMITNNPERQTDPSIEGDHVVWQDMRNDFSLFFEFNSDIYLYDIKNHIEQRITSNIEPQRAPVIFGNRIVWEEHRTKGPRPDIFLYDLKTKEERQLTADKVIQASPAISGNYVIWQDSRNGNKDIYMYDLATDSERPVVTNPENQYYPSISGERIVWSDLRSGNSNIYLYDLAAGKEVQLTSNPSYEIAPAISGDLVVWEDGRNGLYSDIYMYDLKTGKESRITTNPESQTNPAISGHRIVWEDWRNENADIYMYDLETKTEHQITNSPEGQYEPKISGDYIVWEDWHNGDADIGLYNLGDITRPVVPVVTDSGAYTLAVNGLVASWKSADPESELVEYQYQITRDAAEGTVIRDWTSAGLAESVTVMDLTLEHNKKYYFSVKVKNAAELWSKVGYSDGIWVDFNKPTVGAVTPSAGFGTPPLNVNFTAVYKDLDGWQDLKGTWLLINTKINGANCGYFYYNQNTNKLYLRNDDNTAWLGGFAPGSANTIENSKVRLNCANTTVTGSGNLLTITWGVRLKAAFAGTELKNLYLYARDDLGANSGWVKKGTYQLGAGALAPAESSDGMEPMEE